MAPVKLEGLTLGQKHRYHNKLVAEATANPTSVQDIDFNDDINNLLKVDSASKKRDVDYILGILKGNDMLYVSRAIKQSPWLITDNTYAHIINPEYLHSQLIPNMMAKAVNKLMLHIRLTLRDEKRVEDFFNHYEPVHLKTAMKWLPHCSAAFMAIKVQKHINHVDPPLLKRLCEKSHCILEVYVKANMPWGSIRQGFQATMFLLTTHMNFYLGVIEACDSYEFPEFNAKCTKLLMKLCPERIHQKFCQYANRIHIPTFLKFLDEHKVRFFLITQAKLQGESYGWIDFEKIQYFLKKMPLEERIKLITDIFIEKCFKQDKERNDSESSSEDMDVVGPNNDEYSGMKRLYKDISRSGYNDTSELWNWYKCLPFDVVLTEFKEKIKNTTNDYDRNHMFSRLTRIVDYDLRHLETLLQYYIDNHIKDTLSNKVNFIHKLLQRPTNVLRYDDRCWSLLMNIFNSINLEIEESEAKDYYNNDQIMINAIIIHEVINNKEVPQKVTERFGFDTFKEYQKKMTLQERTLLFDYLYHYQMKKIEKLNFEHHAAFDENVELIRLMLQLLNDWQKNLADYPYVLKKINDVIKFKQENVINTRLSWIYDVNKSWRKCMFEVSILLCESDQVCVNALKHDPSLLCRHENVVANMRNDDKVSLRHLLTKLRVYWADSMASEWSQTYKERFTQPLGHKALLRGLCFLLPGREISVIINKYKPEDATINWENNDEVLISLRKHIAKNMHFSRPQPTPEEILQYAKGDYLQFALPSLNAILYNLCHVRSSELIPKLLNSPVSLQKHGIRCAFSKMQSEDLQRIFSDHWKSIKNLSIRAVVFKLTYELLCKENDEAKIENIWSLLTVFVDALTFEEDKTIYELLGKVDKVPLSVRPAYVMRSYRFLKTLLPKADLDKNKYEQTLDALIREMENLIDSMQPEFIAEIIQEYYTAVYTKDTTEGFVHNDIMPLLASFLCCSKTIEIQTQRYKLVLLPLLKQTLAVWATKDKNDIVKTNLKNLLRILRCKLETLVEQNKIVPVDMFAEIQQELQQSLDQNVAYLTLREWELTSAFAKVVHGKKVNVDRSNHNNDQEFWVAICKEAAPQFGQMCRDFLREDINSFFPTIDEYFTKALEAVFNDLLSEDIQVEVLKHMLMEEVIQSYLVTIRILPPYYDRYDGGCRVNNLQEFHKTILSHPSIEVKMHFYHKNKTYRYKNI